MIYFRSYWSPLEISTTICPHQMAAVGIEPRTLETWPLLTAPSVRTSVWIHKAVDIRPGSSHYNVLHTIAVGVLLSSAPRHPCTLFTIHYDLSKYTWDIIHPIVNQLKQLFRSFVKW